MDGSGYKKFKQVVAAQGGNPQALDKFELLPNATGMREITSPRAGYVSAIDAEDIGMASNMIGAGREYQGRHHRSGRGRDSGSEGRARRWMRGAVLCRLYYTKEDHVEEAAGDGGRCIPHFRAEARMSAS